MWAPSLPPRARAVFAFEGLRDGVDAWLDEARAQSGGGRAAAAAMAVAGAALVGLGLVLHAKGY